MADTTDEAANAAANAAKDRAADSSWPPTQNDYEAVGAAAGAAAGAVIGGPAGAALGGVIGTAVGSAVYQLGNAIVNGLNPNYAPQIEYVMAAKQTVETIHTVAARLALECRSDEDSEIGELVHWGLDFSDSSNWRNRSWVQQVGAPGAFAELERVQRGFFAAAVARAAECKTYAEANRHQGIQLKAPSRRDENSGTGIGTVIVAAAGLGGLVWLVSLL